jgi:4-diphosphocytidyl-2C-methyl-D-erythritol kinase
MSTIIRASAPAKVNLVFQVGQLAVNGYHPVFMFTEIQSQNHTSMLSQQITAT